MIGKFLKAYNWTTDRLDSFSGWLKKKLRIRNANRIEKAVYSHDKHGVTNELRKLREKRDRRNKTS